MSNWKEQQMNFDMLLEHVGHNLECVTYGDNVNVSIECVDCNVVLYDIDNPEIISD